MRDRSILDAELGVRRIKAARQSQRYFIDIAKPLPEGRPKRAVGSSQGEADIFERAELFFRRSVAHIQQAVSDPRPGKSPPLARAQVLIRGADSKSQHNYRAPAARAYKCPCAAATAFSGVIACSVST